METRYVLNEDIKNRGLAEKPWLYTYEEAVQYAKDTYGLEKEVSDLIAEKQHIVIEWIIDEDFTILNDEESYSWYESMCEYDFTNEWD